jgi:hypothetical protein
VWLGGQRLKACLHGTTSSPRTTPVEPAGLPVYYPEKQWTQRLAENCWGCGRAMTVPCGKEKRMKVLLLTNEYPP